MKEAGRLTAPIEDEGGKDLEPGDTCSKKY